MGCINNIKIKDSKFTTVITSNQLLKNEKRISDATSDQIYSKKQNENSFPQTNISKNIDMLIANNPLPFVKIIRRKSHL